LAYCAFTVCDVGVNNNNNNNNDNNVTAPGTYAESHIGDTATEGGATAN